MDDNLSSIKKLEEISKGTGLSSAKDIVNEPVKFVLEGYKISNKFLKILITNLKKQNVSSDEILKILQELDEMVENKEVTNSTFGEYLEKGGNNVN